jgi:glycosyltransferase involved in cell wall biosynthesis
MPAVSEWVDPFGLRIKIHGTSKNSRLRDIAYALGVAWTLFRERKDYDVAYFLMSGLHLFTGLPVARMLGKPIVMKFSCSSFVVGLGDSLLGRIELAFLRWWATRILVLNPGMVEEALQVGIAKERIGWMPNPVDTNLFSPVQREQRTSIRRELNLGPDTPVVVFVGRLDPQKKLHWLISAFARVVQQMPDAVLALVGDGSLRAEHTRQVKDLDLDRNVIFAGRQDTAGVVKWLRAGDTFTMVSEVEGLPCSLIEAMSTGLPPVISDIPAHTQLVTHEVHGLVTELGNEVSIAEGLLRILRNSEERARMGAASRRRIEQEFSTSTVVDCYEKLFAECMRSPRP